MSDDKKSSSHRRHYAVLSRETIRAFAEAGGHGSEVPDELASVLAEEVVYRLRELTQVDKLKCLHICVCQLTWCMVVTYPGSHSAG